MVNVYINVASPGMCGGQPNAPNAVRGGHITRRLDPPDTSNQRSMRAACFNCPIQWQMVYGRCSSRSLHLIDQVDIQKVT